MSISGSPMLAIMMIMMDLKINETFTGLLGCLWFSNVAKYLLLS